MLADLDAEVAENCDERGGEPLEWSASERTVLELIACAVDRKVDLWARYLAAGDDEDKLRVKLSGELRLLESNIARLLKQIKTDLPPEPSRTSQKAAQAVNRRWRNGPG